MASVSAPVFTHLFAMTDRRGTFEHAHLAEGQPQHGYCTDDMARVLVVCTREPDSSGEVNGLAGIALRYLNEAQAYSGACRNRMDSLGRWIDEPTTQDHWGRCIWGLGTAAAHSDVGLVRKLAVVQFERAAQARTTSPRAMAFAALGAAELLTADPENNAAHTLISRYAATITEPTADNGWPWPEPRLSYDNAVLPEAMIAVGVALDRPELCQRGLDLLGWLIEAETADGHLSPTPSGGRGPGDPRPGFDQRPTEVATLADACARAAAVDASATWPAGIHAAAAWFHGANDAGQPMWDPATGGGFDGLLADGVNPDQGAESTLAVLSTMQHARRFPAAPQ
ncbi:MAG: glycosyltransferase [Mycobacterium sp.]